MQSISEWLKLLGLDQYAQDFAENDIEFDLLAELSDQSLRDIGVASLGHRLKLLKAIAQLDAEAPADQDVGVIGVSTTQAERRQLTVMFCDLVGSTALSQELDPEALRELMRAYQASCGQVIDHYDGHVAQYLGDGLMTYFGWPRAHEDDAERAVRASLEIVEAVKQTSGPNLLQVRIGIATGPVVVGETGDGDASVPKLAVGETPNLAARIQGLAGPDQIMISPDTRRLVGGTFELDDAGEHTQTGLTPLVGREQEIGLLLERWQQSQDGEGQVVLLSGEPGIGKSRISSALRERLETRGAQALRYQCSPYYINSAFWPITDSLDRVLEFVRDESAESKLDKLESLIVEQYQRSISDVRFAASMLSIPCNDRYGEITITPEKHKDETLRTLVDLIEAAAIKRPSVVLFEDAHWADPSTLEVLDLLIGRVTDIPLLIVLTHRPEFDNRWASHGHVSALNLSKLTRSQSAALVAKVTNDKALPSELLEQILGKTDGVPLFVEELTKSILESGEIADKGDRYEYAGNVHSVTIPATLRDSLMARLDRYLPVKEIAQMGAAIGREFGYELIGAVAPLRQSELDTALAQLTESGLAFRRGTPPNATYTFKHVLVQDAAYDSLLKSRRRELHGKIAKEIEQRLPQTKDTEPEVLAHHLTAGGETKQAIPLWQQAGETALKHMALTEAIAHLHQGLELVAYLPRSRERDTNELALRTTVGVAWQTLKGPAAPEVWNSFHPALTLAKSLQRNDALLPIFDGLMFYVMAQGRVAEALQWSEEMLGLAELNSDADLLIVGHSEMVGSLFNMGKLSKMSDHCEKVLDLYDDESYYHLADIICPEPKTVALSTTTIATWMWGYPDRAVRINNDLSAHAHRRAHPADLGMALTYEADLFELRRESEEIRKRAKDCERLGRENSMPFLSECLAPLRLGLASIRDGRFADGIASLKAGLAFWDSIGGKLWSPYGNSVLAEGMALTGELDSALQLIDQQIDQIERPGWEERVHYAEILRLKGWMLSLKGDLVGAEKNYLASLDWAREQNAKSWELRTSASLTRLWQSQGKRDKALDLLKPVYDWFTEGFDTKDLKEAKALLDELES